MREYRTFAVDMGASGVKCFSGVFKDGSFELKEVYRFEHDTVDLYLPDSSGKLVQRTYWDDLFIYNNILKGIKVYRREFSDRLDSLGIDTWGADGQFINKDGDMISKVYCYRDHRLDNMIKEVESRIEKEKIYGITGIHFQPFNLSNQLLWFIQNRGYMLKEKLMFLPMPTIFYYYLGNVYKVDSTWASITQLMDAARKEWSKDVFDALGIPMEIMPDIVEPGTVLGELLKPIQEDIKLSEVKLVAVGSHDTASAFAAAPVEDIDSALIISSGTWSLIGKLIPRPITDERAMKVNLSNEGGIGNIRLLKNCMGTWLIQELLRKWEESDGRRMKWEEVLDLTKKAHPFNTLIDPDYHGFYNPHDMEEAIVGYCKNTGQGVPEGRGGLLRTVYESLALKYRYINEQIEGVTGKKSMVLHIVGGGSKNELLNQFAANATGLRVLAGPDEASASGNCMAQALALGVIKSMKDSVPLIRGAFTIKEYSPKDTENWNKAYQKFVSIIEKTK